MSMFQPSIILSTNQILENGINNNPSIQQTENMTGLYGNVMTVGGGVGDNAVDVTYSTKPDTQNINAGTTYSTASYNYNNNNLRFSNGGGLMRVNSGNLNSSFNSGYSTASYEVYGRPRQRLYSASSYDFRNRPNLGYNVNTGTVLGVGGGVGDAAADVTYSTKPDNNLVGLQYSRNTFSSTPDVPAYNTMTILPDKIQNIVQREFQPIEKTIIRPFLQI